MKKLALHWWILIGMVAGALFGLLVVEVSPAAVPPPGTTGPVPDEGLRKFCFDWIVPWGDLFLRLLKMIAVPLVLFSLVAGVASLNDTAKMKRIGGKTVALYICTTAVAITIGLIVVNLFGPGVGLDDAVRDSLMATDADKVSERIASANKVKDVGFLSQMIDQLVPQNPFAALAGAEMLQVVVFALLLGIALTRLDTKAADHVVQVFQLLSDAVIQMVMMIMAIAPLGVFALILRLVLDLGKDPEQLAKVLSALGGYMLCVVGALILHGLLVYMPLLRLLGKVGFKRFFKAMAPAQLLAFSSSSSGATLPVTMRACEKGIGVDDEISGFVLPLGATINMDGTGLYQGVAAVFIANVLGQDLGLQEQLIIVLTATLASIGTAAVPGVGMVMLVIVLQQINLPEAAIGLILGVDRPLDMCRTVLNVTGDATVATVVAQSEGLLHEPDPRPTSVESLD